MSHFTLSLSYMIEHAVNGGEIRRDTRSDGDKKVNIVGEVELYYS